MKEPLTPTGFDYRKAILRIRGKMTYQEISEYCGYENASSIARILQGTIPLHPQGEAIYYLYCNLFNEKPK
jgi:hypothetical protein